MCLRHGILRQVSDSFLFVHKLRPVISSIFETIKQWRENGWLGNPWILICQHNEIERGGEVMEVFRVGSGCRRAWGANFFFFFFPLFLLGCSHLLPSHVDMMRTTHCQRFVIATSLDATAREMPLAEAVFQVSLPPEENPQASDRLCYDHISRKGLLSNQSGSGLWPKPCAGRFYMESKLRNTGSRYIKALNHIEL